MLTFGSLFAGIGGFDLGFERAGMVCKWQVEIDEYCSAVLEKHWPDVTRYRDVKEIHGAHSHTNSIRSDGRTGPAKGRLQEVSGRGFSNLCTQNDYSTRNDRPCPTCLPPVDVICGGFPCQPFSAAGKRRGAEDDRNLWPEFRRIVEEVRPRWVVAENVPGIVKIYLDTVLSDLEGLGYTTAQVVIPACAVDAPHRRDRLWIVAYAESENGRRNRQVDTSWEPLQKTKRGKGRLSTNGGGQAMAYAQERTERPGLCQGEPGGQRGRRFSNGSRAIVAEELGNRPQGQLQAGTTTGAAIGDGQRWAAKSRLGGVDDGPAHWMDEPRDVPRVATGIPNRVQRLRALGNAVVPQVAEFIGRLIVEADHDVP